MHEGRSHRDVRQYQTGLHEVGQETCLGKSRVPRDAFADTNTYTLTYTYTRTYAYADSYAFAFEWRARTGRRREAWQRYQRSPVATESINWESAHYGHLPAFDDERLEIYSC